MNAYPKVSILVAARNEEVNILRCLKALSRLDYPISQLEILIGDDASTDQTTTLIKTYITDKPWFELHTIHTSIANLQGKANVLEHLSEKATGEFFFYCDADIQVPTTWIKNMIPHFSNKRVGVINGVTIMHSEGLFADLQSTEWLTALGMFRLFSHFNIPITAMGNNMAVRKQAYQEVGGYSKIGFSLVEDYALFKAIIKQGYSFIQTFETPVLAKSVPNQSLSNQYKQRKRWMQGAMQIPKPLIALFMLLTVFPLIALVVSILIPTLFNLLLPLYFITISIIGLLSILCIKQYQLLYTVAFFGPYLSLMNLLSLVSYFSKGKVEWKQRSYIPDSNMK